MECRATEPPHAPSPGHNLNVFALLFIPFINAAEPTTSGETIFKLSAWSYGRERKTITSSNRVTATVTVKNVSKMPVADVSATLVYMTGLGEKIAGPVTQKVGALKANESKVVNLVCDFVPAFQSYSIVLQYDGKKNEEWFGNSDIGQPEPRLSKLKGQALVVIVGKEVTVDKNGVMTGTLHVKNEGTEAAQNVKYTISFVDLNKRKLKDFTQPLGKGTVDGNADKEFPIEIHGIPRNFGGYSIAIANDDVAPETALQGGDFTGAAEVEFLRISKSLRPKPKREHYTFGKPSAAMA